MAIGSTAEPHFQGSSDEPARSEVADVLWDLWQKRRPEVIADLERLITLLTDLSNSPDTDESLIESCAKTAALVHQLHGAFGVFGWSALKARLGAVEQALVVNSPNHDHIAAVQSVLSELP
jgi:hypothetical protein